MESIIAVRGVANRGKSASIKRAYQLLKAAHPNAIIEERVIRADITVILTIDGMKVGIESQGDPNSRLFVSLKYFVQVGCRVIVCATRSSGRTVDAVRSHAGRYQIKWIDKQNEPNAHAQETANDAVAREIVALVESAITA